jgi:hypothetical protein
VGKLAAQDGGTLRYFRVLACFNQRCSKPEQRTELDPDSERDDRERVERAREQEWRRRGIE